MVGITDCNVRLALRAPADLPIDCEEVRECDGLERHEHDIQGRSFRSGLEPDVMLAPLAARLLGDLQNLTRPDPSRLFRASTSRAIQWGSEPCGTATGEKPI